MKKKQILIFVLSIFILVIFNKVFLSTFTKTNAYFTRQAIVNSEEIAPQKLFDKTWKVISKEYYEPSLNHQDWYRWKEHYQGKIKTDEDARVAIDTMIASLDEPYTRFMNKKDFEDLTTSITSKIYGIGVNIYSNAGKIEIFKLYFTIYSIYIFTFITFFIKSISYYLKYSCRTQIKISNMHRKAIIKT